MRIVRYTPSLNRNMQSLDRVFENVFHGLFDPASAAKQFATNSTRKALVDVYEDETKIHLNFELAGVEKEDIQIELKEGELSVTAKSSTEFGDFDYKRTIALPDSVNPEKSSAELKNGVLLVSFAKKEEVKARRISIN